MNIADYVHALQQLSILPNEEMTIQKLSGGTVSEVYQLDIDAKETFVLKKHFPDQIKAEARFFQMYEGLDILPTPIYVEPSFDFAIYPYLKGSCNNRTISKARFLTTLVEELFSRYKAVESGWGWAGAPVESWSQFLQQEVAETKPILAPFLAKDDHLLVTEAIQRVTERMPLTKPFLLHGDCGIHNVMTREDDLTGVIDPDPVYGPPLFDLLYAFCSYPLDLSRSTILHAARTLDGSAVDDYLDPFVLICLYLRMATSMRHHPEDFSAYQTSWLQWKAYGR
ncbi:aminoglycoside phosphotransferase family protein [Shouchella sp. JSM 1781072]|uniref:aminoglycoside phosphotransferase family protein n=1 Tax=Bacillaceae TaxID=186817 RepID=UPI0020D03514|nr:aminoglycoside phosphotransferase family protein [Alkalihalobacillus sp. LMS6]UTR05970.1 aminoglycoside phosphotransferase family protein [Alkalihalobacillus sp. LMS6]